MCYIRMHVITEENIPPGASGSAGGRGQYMLEMMRQYLLDQRMLKKDGKQEEANHRVSCMRKDGRL